MSYNERTVAFSSVGSERRKLRRTGFGWAAGAGNFLAADAMMRLLTPASSGEPAPLAEAIRAARAYEVRRIQAEMQTPDAELDRTTVVYIWRSAIGLALNALTFSGNEAIAGAQYAALTPPELAPSRVASVNQALASRPIAPQDARGIIQNLRVIGKQFSDVAREADSVGDIVEVGLLIDGQNGMQIYFTRQPSTDLHVVDVASLSSRLRAV